MINITDVEEALNFNRPHTTIIVHPESFDALVSLIEVEGPRHKILKSPYIPEGKALMLRTHSIQQPPIFYVYHDDLNKYRDNKNDV